MASSIPQLRFYKDETLNAVNAEKLNELYNLFKDDNTKWISRQECLNLKNAENCIFVFCKFDGAAFEHIRNLNSRIISASCMLYTYKNQKKLPRSSIPIYSSSMVDLNVCCSNMEKKLREEIYVKVEMMRGKISKIFTENVTHLVTTEVGSAKYHAAGSMKIPVMLAEWVLEVWKDAEYEDCHATDAKFLKYKCPIFHKLVICASGYNEEVKSKIKSMVESEGGTYRGDLVCGTTTHLVLNEAKGAKYDHAKLWKIIVVKSEWIYESIKAGYCLPEKDFILETDNQTSTPSESRIMASKTKKIPDIDLSVINPLNNTNANSTKIVNETDRNGMFMNGLNQSTSMLMNTTNSASSKNLTQNNKPMTHYSDLMKELNSIGKIKLTLLDGIGIFCEITDSAVSEKIKKICNLGGAIRFDEYNSDVTHVIVNQVNDQKCKSYIELNPEVNIVTIDWLVNSCKQNQLEDCKMYCVFKNALNSVKTPKKRARPEKSLSNQTMNNQTFDSDLNDCLSQYLNMEANLMKPQQEAISRPFQTNTPTRTSSLSAKLQQYQKEKQETPKMNTTLKKDPPINDAYANEIFYKKKFQIIGFDNEEQQSIEKILIQKGALVLPSYDLDATEMPMSRLPDDVDFTLFPLITSTPIVNKNPATVYWMKRCCELNQLLPLNFNIFFQPIPRYNTDRPLTNCVITISSYDQSEKENITNLCKLLGAHTQSSFSLKKSNDIQVNTHLICNQTVGPKYIAAKTWNMPVVCAEWVIECCVTGMKADENKYSVENQKSIQNDLIEALSKIRRQNEDMCTNSSYNSKANNTCSKSMNVSVNDFQNEHNPNDSSLTCHNESKKPRLDDDEEDQEKTRDNNFKSNNLNDTDSDLVLAAIENSAKFKVPNQFETASNFQTPQNPRLKELRRSEVIAQPVTPVSENNKYSTPVWMKPDNGKQTEFKFKNLDCDKALEMLKTPDAFNTSKFKSKKPETPLCELFTNAIHIAAEKSKNPEYWANCYESPAFEYSFQRAKRENENYLRNQDHDQSDYIQPTARHKILRNCKVYVSRKLVKIQSDLYKIVDSLGGDFSWTYNQDITHFIYSGDINDNVKELKTAIEDRKIIVLPDWIYSCHENQSHLDETNFMISKINEAESNCPENSEMTDETKLKEEEMTTDENQVDLKRAFLDQLQDKLASLKNVNTSKKLGRNKSDVNKSDLSEMNENKTTLNGDDETALLENLEFNDMTKNKNVDLGMDYDEEEENSKRRQMNLKRKANMPSVNSNDNLSDVGKKSIKNLGKNDDAPGSPSLLNKDLNGQKKTNSNMIPHSQIQVTYWKDDSAPGMNPNLAPTQNKMTTRQRSTKTESTRGTRADAIAERIMTAARAAKKT
ncbi:unnamed protein product [Brachionus calyciflorus]|uniref:BRCT domain-containing protein n=1 Tax=Brachionus calyciflorus TaxID=104777 RepID=A0A814DPH1_9BILA|nr:unnamed protein product [Brachionus calyciflorus]